jgi:hypothetical protein
VILHASNHPSTALSGVERGSTKSSFHPTSGFFTHALELGCVRRRTVLAAATGFASASGGCLAGSGGPEFTVSDPPDSLREEGDCPSDDVVASLSLGEPTESPRSEAAVVRYEDLQEPAKLVFRFYRARGSAVTCREPKRFSILLGDLGEHGTDPYREEHGDGPEWLYVRTHGTYHRVHRLRVYDAVLEY